MRAGDVIIAACLALGLHGALAAHFLGVRGVFDGAATGGTDTGMSGEGGVSLAAPDYADLIAAWEAPPDPIATSPDETAPEMAVLPPPEMALPPLSSQDFAAWKTAADTPVDLSDDVEALPIVRPQPRPERKAKAAPVRTAKTNERAKPQSNAGAPRRSTGDGTGGTVSGKARAKTGNAPAASGGASKAQRASLISQWGAGIRRTLQRAQRYPSAAKGAHGEVKLALKVAPNGSLLGVSVARGSGVAALDRAAIAAAQGAGRFPRAPNGLKDASYSFSISLNFKRR